MGGTVEDLDPLIGPIEQGDSPQMVGIEELERALAERVDDPEGWICNQDRSARCGRRIIPEEIAAQDATALRIDVALDHLAASSDQRIGEDAVASSVLPDRARG